MLQGYTMAIVPCGNPTPKKLPTGGGEWPTFCTARAQRTVRPHTLGNVLVIRAQRLQQRIFVLPLVTMTFSHGAGLNMVRLQCPH